MRQIVGILDSSMAYNNGDKVMNGVPSHKQHHVIQMTRAGGNSWRPDPFESPKGMTTDPEDLWEDQSISDYLKQEIEFTSSVFAGIAQTHGGWKAHENINTSARRFLGIIFAAITDWKRDISSIPKEEEGEEDIIDDPKDSDYRENWMPTSLYRW